MFNEKTLVNNSILYIKRLFLLLSLASLLLAGLALLSTQWCYATTAPTATCRVDAAEGVNLRKSASTSSKSLKVISNNKKLTIKKAVFTSSSSTSKTKIWYYVSYGGKNGYVRSDCVDNITYSSKSGTCKDYGVNLRVGAGTGMKSCGIINQGDNFKILLAATAKDSTYKNWYLIKFNGKKAYAYSKYVKFGTTKAVKPSDNPNRSSVAKALLKNPTVGGDARIVYTFTESNCKKKWSSGIKGWSSAEIPQGLAYTGSKYCAVFAMDSGIQALCTYDKKGNKLKNIQILPKCGHRNGLTWNAKTGKYYIGESGEKKLITYDPDTGKFGSVYMPTTASGIAYDRKTGNMIATVQTLSTGIIVYSGDGKFTIKKTFPRCSRDFSYYCQDSGAHHGYVFHCISAKSSPHTLNYIDVYRVEDGRYLGTIKSKLDEMESCVVNSDGYLELLCNRKGEPDYVWVTPLKVSDLK